MINKYWKILKYICIPFVAILLIGNLVASPETILKQHTYRLSTDKQTWCQLPIIDTEFGAFTAAHCIESLEAKGYKKFWGKNDLGQIKQFRLLVSKYEFKGLDYAFLTDFDKIGIKLGDSKHLKINDLIYIYSPKLGLSQGRIIVVPDEKYNFKIYIDIGQCGESGSGVYNKDAKLIGIFVARTGSPLNPRGVFIPMHKILEDLR